MVALWGANLTSRSWPRHGALASRCLSCMSGCSSLQSTPGTSKCRCLSHQQLPWCGWTDKCSARDETARCTAIFSTEAHLRKPTLAAFRLPDESPLSINHDWSPCRWKNDGMAAPQTTETNAAPSAASRSPPRRHLAMAALETRNAVTGAWRVACPCPLPLCPRQSSTARKTE